MSKVVGIHCMNGDGRQASIIASTLKSLAQLVRATAYQSRGSTVRVCYVRRCATISLFSYTQLQT